LRGDCIAYHQRFGGVDQVANKVFLEASTASGNQPIETRELQSYLARFLRETGQNLGAEDETPFSMRLLHFRRTFVEKLFAIHASVELLKRDGRAIGNYAHHYYDLYQLARTPDVPAMLATAEYIEIKADYDRISSTVFARNYFAPKDFRFSNSDTLFPTTNYRPLWQPSTKRNANNSVSTSTHLGSGACRI
jgi:hypothetical protein